MRLPDKYIRTQVYGLLSLDLSVPIRDMVARVDDKAPYVILSSQNNFNEQIKCTFGVIHSILIQVYGKQQTTVSRASIEGIADDILQSIIKMDSRQFIDGGTSWQIVSIWLDSSNDDTTFTGDKISARKNMIINFRLRQLDNN